MFKTGFKGLGSVLEIRGQELGMCLRTRRQGRNLALRDIKRDKTFEIATETETNPQDQDRDPEILGPDLQNILR